MAKVNLPDETVEKLMKNEFEINVNDEEVTEEVTEEVVQAVAEAIVEEAEEHNTSVEEVVNEIIEEAKETEEVETKAVKYNKVDYKSRGFKSLDDAILFMETPYFKGLGEADKNEYRNWLIKK